MVSSHYFVCWFLGFICVFSCFRGLSGLVLKAVPQNPPFLFVFVPPVAPKTFPKKNAQGRHPSYKLVFIAFGCLRRVY